MGVAKSSDLFINMKDVPEYNPRKHFYDQKRHVLEFYQNEKKKITEGVKVGSYHMHPWLYWHINFFKTPIPQTNGQEVIMCPPLDDNMIYVTDTYKEAESLDKGVGLFGARGTTKSSIITSLNSWLATTKPNGTSSIIGGSDGDLKAISSLLETSFSSIHPAFRLPRLQSNWNSEIEFGVREKNNEKIIHSRISITNANKGGAKESEKGAGLSPVGFTVDEFGKFKILDILLSALPSFMTPHGAKLTHFLAGCVCAGTKVWNNKGRLINIEDVIQEEGILGYNVEAFEVSKEKITYWQSPHQKPCYRIETNSGRVLECSDDHPIFCRDTKINTYDRVTKKRGRWMGFREAKDLRVKNLIGVSSFMPFEGDMKMWEPRFTGWLIGDGTYGHDKSTRLASCDDEVNDYVQDNFDYTVIRGYKTKDGKEYKETRIRGIRGHLTNIGIANQTGSRKTLPKDIHLYNISDIQELLGGFYDADGHVMSLSTAKSNNYSVNLSSGHKSILTEVQFLLQRLGIHANIHFKKDDRVRAIGNGKVFKAKGHYVLSVCDKLSVLEFHKNIRFAIGYKQEKLEEAVRFFADRGVKVSVEYRNMRFEAIKSIVKIGSKPVYNLTAGNTNTYIAGGIITHNTGGNVILSKSAKDILENPDEYRLLPMDFTRLERGVPNDMITWIDSYKDSFCTFMPGQMSYRLKSPKKKTNLAAYLDISDKELAKVNINVTDWIGATTQIAEDEAALKKEETINKHKMYFPTKIAHCFLVGSINPFPVAVINKRIKELEDDGNIGKDIDIWKDGSISKYELVNKKRAAVSHEGGTADAPIILFGAFPETPPDKYIFVSGHDGYKIDGAKTPSLGTFYVLERRNLKPDSPFEKIVCSYSARPDNMLDFLANGEKIVKTWNAMCCIEAMDIAFKYHLQRKNEDWKYLAPAFSFAASNSGQRYKGATKYGLHPTSGNNTFRFNLLISSMREEFTIGVDDDGNTITKYGVEFIDDVDLLKEMRDYKDGGNYDRIDGYSHALVYARQLDDHNVQPNKVAKKPTRSQNENRARLTSKNRYGINKMDKY